MIPYHYELTSLEYPDGKDPSEEATQLPILHSHLIKEAVVIFVHSDVDLREAQTSILQAL